MRTIYDQSTQAAGGWISPLARVDAERLWRALVKFAEGPEQFNLECEMKDGITRLNEARTE